MSQIQVTPELLEQALAQYFGIPAEQVKPTFEQLTATVETVQQLQPMVVSQWREKELGKLKDKWGAEFDDVYKYVVDEVFPSLPPEEQAKWNNADGLQFLAEQHRDTIESRISSSKENPAQLPAAESNTQRNAPGTIAPANGTPTKNTASVTTFKQSQLLNMSPDEWKQNESAIQQAYASGAVEMDIVD